MAQANPPAGKQPTHNRKKYVVNLSGCPYDLVAECAREMGCVLDFDKTSKNFNLWFTATGVSQDRVKALQGHQKINHFPGMLAICRKDDLAENLNRMRRACGAGGGYDFYPTTYCLPLEWRHFAAAINPVSAPPLPPHQKKSSTGPSVRANKRAQINGKTTWIIKPKEGHGGKGIYLTNSIKNVERGMVCESILEYCWTNILQESALLHPS